MQAIIKSIKTSIDGGYIVSFDLPESEREEVKKLLDMLGQNVSLEVKL
jgi:hypothetical protein